MLKSASQKFVRRSGFFKNVAVRANSGKVTMSRGSAMFEVSGIELQQEHFTGARPEPIQREQKPEIHETVEEQVAKLANRVLAGERAGLAKAITLVESQRYDHQTQAHMLISEILKTRAENHSLGDEHKTPTFRVGISGPPGAGKSTFIEAMGKYLTSHGIKVAVLAVDPSSSRSGGSILGDKTRMIELSRDPMAYVRPSPSRCFLGGVTAHAHEIIMLCEANGYDVVLVETVGVGQSEIEVADLVDMYVLVVPPGGGDELQGIKKGIVEMCDMVIVNKADGHLLEAAKLAKQEYSSALELIQTKTSHYKPKVLMCSSLQREKIDQVWTEWQSYKGIMDEAGELSKKRTAQRSDWMWKQIKIELMQRLLAKPQVQGEINELQHQVLDGSMSPRYAAEHIVNTFYKASE